MTNNENKKEKMPLPDENSRSGIFNNLKIGDKLMIGFGILIIITLAVIVFSYLGSDHATSKINKTLEIRSPAARVSIQAQAKLFRMLLDVRGYLALGNKSFIEEYEENRRAFEKELYMLNRLSVKFSRKNKERLRQLEDTYKEWIEWPYRLFELRDDQFEREPAYKLMSTDATLSAGHALIDINTMIETQGNREPTADNLELLKDMAKFQGTFTAMFSGMRGYVTTRNRIYRQEFEVNQVANENHWERLIKQRRKLSKTQAKKLEKIEKNRKEFLTFPDRIFELLESPRWREDLYLFKTETVPRTETMQRLLKILSTEQVLFLIGDLKRERTDLAKANLFILISGVVASVLGLVLALTFRRIIAEPVGRLTQVADRIRAGDLEVLANIESGDEIGILAATFNNMTGKLRRTLFQVQKEKKRADDLLDVVIPIGVGLASEKDFNRLLENMLLEAKKFCNADAGILYLRSKDDHLEFVIVRNDRMEIIMGGTTGNKVTFPPLALYLKDTGEPNHQTIAAHVALAGESVNIPDMGQSEQFTFSGVDFKKHSEETYYQDTSYLAIPLKNSQNEVIGVMQLINAQDSETSQIIPFDSNLQQMMESFSSLAVAALEAYIREQSLRQEIKQLRIEIDETKRQK
ncbi:MAG: HAMP domain-containing protein [Desulfobacterales bacterium]|nr:HAMP domain-containing protein [Desulfobacterales bacterium]